MNSKLILTPSLIFLMMFLLPQAIHAAESKPAESKSGESKSAGSKIDRGSKSFIQEANEGGMMEVELGKLAADHASNTKVKEFGKRMADDHSKAGSELKDLAAKKDVKLDNKLSAKHKSLVQKLSKAHDGDFDKQYMRRMVDDHEKDVKAFEHQAKNGKDEDVKALASKTLPTLKEHLKLAHEVAKEVKAEKH